MDITYINEVDFLTNAIRIIEELRKAIPLKFSTEAYTEINELLSEINKKLSVKLVEEV